MARRWCGRAREDGAAAGAAEAEECAACGTAGDEEERIARNVDLFLVRLGCAASAAVSLGFALARSPWAMYPLIACAAASGPSLPAQRALFVRAVAAAAPSSPSAAAAGGGGVGAPAADACVATGRALAGLGVIESVSSLITPLWLGALYAALAERGHAAWAFYSMVATAGSALLIMLLCVPSERASA